MKSVSKSLTGTACRARGERNEPPVRFADTPLAKQGGKTLAKNFRIILSFRE